MRMTIREALRKGVSFICAAAVIVGMIYKALQIFTTPEVDLIVWIVIVVCSVTLWLLNRKPPRK